MGGWVTDLVGDVREREQATVAAVHCSEKSEEPSIYPIGPTECHLYLGGCVGVWVGGWAGG